MSTWNGYGYEDADEPTDAEMDEAADRAWQARVQQMEDAAADLERHWARRRRE